MAEILSQAQIDELLASFQANPVDIAKIENKKVRDYDFLSPKLFSRGNLKLLESVFHDFIKVFTVQLTGMLRSTCRMEIVQIEEQKYREYNNALSDSVLVGVISMNSEEHSIENKQYLVDIDRHISFLIIDHMLGGRGGDYRIEREYTDIELTLIQYLFGQMMPIFRTAWSPHLIVEHSLDSVVTNSRLLQFIQPDESVAIVVIELTIGETKGNITVCLPSGSLEEIFRVYNSKFARPARKTDLRELNLLEAGDVLLLQSPPKGGRDSVVVNVEGQPWFSGVLGTRRNKYAVRIDGAAR